MILQVDQVVIMMVDINLVQLQKLMVQDLLVSQILDMVPLLEMHLEKIHSYKKLYLLDIRRLITLI